MAKLKISLFVTESAFIPPISATSCRKAAYPRINPHPRGITLLMNIKGYSQMATQSDMDAFSQKVHSSYNDTILT